MTLPAVRACELPAGALLGKYRRDGTYADCYVAEVAIPVSLDEYAEAFYTTAIFRLERLLLAWFARRPSTDAQAKELAAGTRRTFAAWTVEDRGDDQLLLADLLQRTRSWLMTVPAGPARTRLYFGSAVVPVVDPASGKASLGFTFRALLGFHKLYSRVLLRSASVRLARARKA